jgi:phospholipid transport system substrate-binding protein
MKTRFTLALWMAVLLAPSVAFAGDTPNAMVDASSKKVLALVQQNREKGQADVDALTKDLLKLLDPVVDFEAIAVAVMGQHYAAATPQQRQRFVPVFKNTLVLLYAKTLVKFEIERIDVPAADPAVPPSGNVVMAVTAADGKTYSIAYTMRQGQNKKWRVRNVTLDGINLGLTYRNQFDSAMNRYQGDIDKVIASWTADMEATK